VEKAGISLKGLVGQKRITRNQRAAAEGSEVVDIPVEGLCTDENTAAVKKQNTFPKEGAVKTKSGPNAARAVSKPLAKSSSTASVKPSASNSLHAPAKASPGQASKGAAVVAAEGGINKRKRTFERRSSTGGASASTSSVSAAGTETAAKKAERK
jgi:hypothetical protein